MEGTIATITQNLEQRVGEMEQDLERARAALAALRGSNGGAGNGHAAPKRRGRPPRAARQVTSPSPAGNKPAPATNGRKRQPQGKRVTAEEVLVAIRAGQGENAVRLAEALNTSPRIVRGRLVELEEAERVRREGAQSHTRYVPVGA